ncbi:MAG: DUF192 domain-containing protein [Candidatus Peribacteraceae bacterium]|nr:DUF192 domain-containing protein [Candidatus Peribacteraceae bacterium]
MRKLFLASVCLFLASCGTQEITLSSLDGSKQIPLTVEVVKTEKDRSKGLQNRTKLEEGHGMLFVFDTPQMVSLWMKDTKIPLDMLFFDINGDMASAEDNVQPCPPDTKTCPQYKSREQTTAVLEVPAGWRVKNGVGVGWRLKK